MKVTIERVCEAIITEWYLESTDFREIFEKHIKDFEALVRADEREECAKVCEENHEMWRWDNEPDSISGPRYCANAIRTRSIT